MGNNGVESPTEVSIGMEFDRLEEKVQKAVEMIDRLRKEKQQLETENERLRSMENECLRLMEEREETVNRLSRILEKVDSIESLS